MKPNRQKTYYRPTFQPPKMIPQPTNQYFSQTIKPSHQKNNTLQLISLIQSSNTHQLTLNCNGKLTIKRLKSQLKSKRAQNTKNNDQNLQEARFVYAINRSQNLIKKCFQGMVNSKMTCQYVFKANNQFSEVKRYGFNGKNITFMQNVNINKNKTHTKLSSNSQQKTKNEHNHKPKRSKQKDENINSLNKYCNKKYQSQITPQMFTVQQMIGQSIQQDPQQVIKHKPFHNIKNQPIIFNKILAKNDDLLHDDRFKQNHFSNRQNCIKINQKHHSQFQSQHKQNKQPQNKIKSEINYFQNQNKIIDKQQQHKQNQLFNSIELQHCESQIKEIRPQKFSFAKEIKQGIIEHQPFRHQKWQSFKLVSDEQLQHQKKKLKNMNQFPLMSEMNQLSQISSIISVNNIKESQMNKQLDSIKMDLENYDTSCRKLPLKKQSQRQKVHQVDKKHIQMRYEIGWGQEDISDLIQITKKQNENSQNEYHVKYNLRFLDKNMKSKAQVIRISPLKFRKKQQVVRHFMQTKIIQKQSNSINIP